MRRVTWATRFSLLLSLTAISTLVHAASAEAGDPGPDSFTVSPPPLCCTAATYLPTTGRIYMYGGLNGNTSVSDDLTYKWNWTQVTWESDNVHQTIPGPVSSTRMVWFGGLNKAILFGGHNCQPYPTSCPRIPNDTYSFDGMTWGTLATSGTPPGKRTSEGLAWDQNSNVVVLFGGDGMGHADFQPPLSPLRDSFWLDTTSTWVPCQPVQGCNTLPGARGTPTIDYDPTTHKDIMFGGSSSGPNWGDTWFYDQSNVSDKWAKCDSSSCATSESQTCTLPTQGPCPRYGHRMTYYSAGSEMAVFGGQNASLLRNDVWLFTGDVHTGLWTGWTPPPPGSIPGVRCCMLWVADPTRGTVLMFGGGKLPQPAAWQDTWYWTSSGGWVCKASCPAP